MPNAMTSGLYCAIFGLIVALGLSNLQYVDMNSPRNQFIIGFAIFNCLSIAGPGGYMTNVEGNPFGSTNAADIAYASFSSPMIIAFLCAFPPDNTVAGTREERGLHIWDKIQPHDVNNDPEYVEVYSLPIGLAKIFRNCGYLEYPALGQPNQRMATSPVVPIWATCAVPAGSIAETTLMTPKLSLVARRNMEMKKDTMKWRPKI